MREVSGLNTPVQQIQSEPDGDPRASMTLVVLVFGAILVFAVVLALQALYFNAQESERQVKTYIPSDELTTLRAGQFDRLMAELRIIAPAIGRSICLEPAARRGWAR
jgi:hypothetical protein